jgi:hypothetical protein
MNTSYFIPPSRHSLVLSPSFPLYFHSSLTHSLTPITHTLIHSLTRTLLLSSLSPSPLYSLILSPVPPSPPYLVTFSTSLTPSLSSRSYSFSLLTITHSLSPIPSLVRLPISSPHSPIFHSLTPSLFSPFLTHSLTLPHPLFLLYIPNHSSVLNHFSPSHSFPLLTVSHRILQDHAAVPSRTNKHHTVCVGGTS